MRKRSILSVMLCLIALVIVACGSGSSSSNNRCRPLFKPSHNWVKSASNPVVTPSGSGWDADDADQPSVIFNGTSYQMWYAGNNSGLQQIGYATSNDGETWSTSGASPVLSIGTDGEWDDTLAFWPSVIFNGTSYQMWYSGNDGTNMRIGYATSDDGETWTKYISNPVLDLGGDGAWDDNHVYGTSVIYDGTQYQMWYSGNDGTHVQIGHATSADGITWTKYASNPVLTLGGDGEWDDYHTYAPDVLYDGCGGYHMWYAGYDGSTYKIGYASSNNGLSWTRNDMNPVINSSVGGAWDDSRVTSPDVIYNGTALEMWFAGKGSTYQIGHAIEN